MAENVVVRSRTLQESLDETQDALRALTAKLDTVQKAGRWNWIVTLLLVVIVASMISGGVYVWRDGIHRDQATTESRIIACEDGNKVRAAIIAENQSQDRRLIEAAVQLSGGNFTTEEAEQFLGIVAAGDPSPALLPVNCEKSVRGR